jgi:hypothetical protein
MDLLHLVDRLEELVASAQKMPIGNRAIIDRRRLLDIVDQMRVAIPEEVLEAQRVASMREELQRQAEEEAQMVVARAEEQAARLIDQHELTEAARARATELEQEAEARLEARIGEANADIQSRILESRNLAQEQMSAADDYARELLTRLERQLQAFAGSVRSGIDQLQPDIERMPPPEVEQEVAGELEASSVAAPVITDQPPTPLHPTGDHPSEGDLENLLDREAAEESDSESHAAAVGASQPGLIDDFSNPSLDDDPATPVEEERPD